MMRRKRVLQLVLRAGVVTTLASVSLWGSPGAAGAASSSCGDTWVGSGGNLTGDWSNPADWSAGVPGTNTAVCITTPGTYTVTLDGASDGGDTIASLQVGGASGTQTLDIAGQSWITGMNEIDNDIALDVSGSASIASNAAVVLDATGTGATTGGSTDSIGGNAELNAGTLINAGTLTGQVEDSKWTTRIGGTVTNTGTINISSGSLVMPSADEGGTGSTGGVSFTNAGTINVATSGELSLDEVQGASASTFTQNGTIANAGEIVATANNTGAGSLIWNQNGGTETGNPVQMQSGILLDDTAGSGAFLFNYYGGGIEGTIPSGQTVTFDGESSVTSMNEVSNTDTLDLEGKTLVNDGTFTIDATAMGAKVGASDPTGATAQLTDGGISNAGTLNLEVDDPTYEDQLNVGINNLHGANVTASGGKAELSGGGTVNNDGTITVDPGANLLEDANPFLTGPETFNANADGTIVPQIASPSSFGVLTLGGDSNFTAGGTVAPQLLGGYTPAVGQQFAVFPLGGGPTIKGTFGTVSNGFSASYANESSSGISLAYTPAPVTTTTTTTSPTTITPAPKVTAVKSVNGKVVVALACTAATGCGQVKVTVSITEKLKHGKVVALSAAAGLSKRKPVRTTTKTLVIASAVESVPAHGKKTLTLSLTSAGRKLLAAHHHLKAAVTVKVGTKTLKHTAVTLTVAKTRRSTTKHS